MKAHLQVIIDQLNHSFMVLNFDKKVISLTLVFLVQALFTLAKYSNYKNEIERIKIMLGNAMTFVRNSSAKSLFFFFFLVFLYIISKQICCISIV